MNFENCDAVEIVKDIIKVLETMWKVSESFKCEIIKNQELIADCYEKLKSAEARKVLEEQMKEAYLRLLEIDSEIVAIENNLKELNKLKKGFE